MSTYLHPSEATRARMARDRATADSRAATAVTVTLSPFAACAFVTLAEERAERAREKADDATKDAEFRAYWLERAAEWDREAANLNAVLVAERVAR